MNFWQKALYKSSILILIAVVLTLIVTQSVMSVIFTIQTQEVRLAIPELISKVIVFTIEFLYITSVMLFLANITKIAKFVAVFAIFIHLGYRTLNMFISYQVTGQSQHLTNMAMVILGIVALVVYIKFSKYANKTIKE